MPVEDDHIATPKMWKCGEPYAYPVPKSDDNQWEVILETLLRKDKAQCDAWKDEVQNLLIFAGLFSAVVTAFVIESYQSMQPDPGDMSVVLLGQILSQLQNNTVQNNSITSSPLAQSGFLPVSSGGPTDFTRVNTFWFLSLILSLATVLIGIVCLQWLREHQRYSDAMPAKQALGIFHMRADALEKWRVPHIFATLPVLLQAALVLFFVGIVDFLFALSRVVAIPVAIAVSITILFIITTTVLPTLQCITVSLRRPMSNSPVPLPCSFKSPQSLAFKRIMTSSRPVFIAIHTSIVYTIYLLTVLIPCKVHTLLLQRSIPSLPQDTWKYRLFSYRAYLFWEHRTWLDFDRTFLILRNEHFDITRSRSSSDGLPTQSLTLEPIYDAVGALASAVKLHEHDDHILFSAYHCFQELAQAAREEQAPDGMDNHLQACYRRLIPTWNSPIANIASLLAEPDGWMLHDIHTVLILRLPGFFFKAINPAHPLGRHTLELHTRILVSLFAGPPQRVAGRSEGSTGFFHWYTINMDSLWRFPETEDVFYKQYLLIFEAFIATSASICDSFAVHRTFHTHSDLDEFVSLAAYFTWRIVEGVMDGNKDSTGHLKMLYSSLAAMNSKVSPDTSTSGDHSYLVCCAALFLHRLWEERPSRLSGNVKDHPELVRLGSILDTLHARVLQVFGHDKTAERLSNLYGTIISPTVHAKLFDSRGFSDHMAHPNPKSGSAEDAVCDVSREQNSMDPHEQIVEVTTINHLPVLVTHTYDQNAARLV